MAPSDLHIDLQHRPFAWLRSRITRRGFRGGVEIPIAKGYIADAVATADFQSRFDREYTNQALGQMPTPHMMVFEAKVSVSDLRKSFKGTNGHANRLTPIGSLHWVVIPTFAKGERGLWLSALETAPEFWGILQARGHGLSEIRPPEHCALSVDSYRALCVDVLWFGVGKGRRNG